LAAAIREAQNKAPSSKRILLTPQGRCFDQNVASELTASQGLILVCGRYEGVDERICFDFIDDEISIGDYVLTGGELAAMVIIDAVTRLLPGALGGEDAAERDSFSDGILEHPHYTRPRIFEGSEVPEVLLSGHHQDIEKWRLETSLIRTFLRRKDLLEKRSLSRPEIEILKKWCRDIEELISDQSLHSPDALSGD
jgi:tRNA (guanine37-N1)-methyltransferase